MPLTLDDFDYDLPRELIAQRPAEPRSASRLLRVTPGAISDHLFSELPGFLAAGDLLVCNDTRVIKARLLGEKATGGRIEVLIERVLGANEALAQVRASHAPRPGARLRLAGCVEATVTERRGDLYVLRFDSTDSVYGLLDRHGSLPLPPYIGHAPDAADEQRYQTLYARSPGAVAAPTAGLHFDERVLAALRAKGVDLVHLTLHVGAGTFQPVRTQDLSRHRMHAEHYEIPQGTAAAVAEARARGGSIVAVGTTSVRALESAARGPGEVAAGPGETRLFITPGYAFRIVDRLLTNFHLPKSTLLMLVSAFAGLDPIRRAYAHAIEQHYRFFSYGDAMLIDKMHR
ncbi:MAG: tRNA preQ1(34) S-adenosylmethionine ribosyltransferase-isomerase QueA [Betaproteobacteria bacterium RIFCSPLOWO2_12_FULL_65_110]|nr:MAG: tRNA preQ1(34) S-adenosylmethionine ribosyltransferase-isomerase QueA [Betaproteobacteria bacterium RIFCSPLOWO2_02_FULL_65_20]OGA40189.1 MAG: tRNA preQ1(34) S-adenosylmethionine ribosyltransferase-isomerase QueA [Betaproteobacteria bacterium RIFCSPLOWO2_12_FULL_65_110]